MAEAQGADTVPVDRPATVAGLLALLTALGAMSFLLWTAILWYRYHTHIPWRDLYLVVGQVKTVFAADFGLTDLASWFELHYKAHRIFMLRALVALDMLWLSGQNHLLYATAWFCLLGTVLGIACAIRAHGWPDRATPVFAASLVALYLFSPSHLWNILNPVNVSWHMTMAGAVAAFALLLYRPAPPGPLGWLGAFLLATIAAFSTFAGVLAWLILPLLALYLRSRYFLAVSVFCVGATLLYCQGIASDATVVANWSGGSADAVARFRAQGQEALAGNTPWQIGKKTIALLGWPLGRDYPLTAALLALASLTPVGWALWTVASRRWSGRHRPGRLLELSLFTALLCLGIALVTHLGRIIPQPVHVQGPSQERLQSVVLLYWACVSLLLLLASARFSTRLRSGVLLAVLALGVLVTAPNGTYLKEEILSMEYAARLQSLGEQKILRKKANKKALDFRPERIFKLDSFLAEHQLAYQAPLALPASQPTSTACETLEDPAFASFPGRPELQPIALRFGGLQGLLTREVLAAAETTRVARFFPIHRGNYTPLGLLRTDKLAWSGVVTTALPDPGGLQVYLRLPTGIRPACRL